MSACIFSLTIHFKPLNLVLWESCRKLCTHIALAPTHWYFSCSFATLVPRFRPASPGERHLSMPSSGFWRTCELVYRWDNRNCLHRRWNRGLWMTPRTQLRRKTLDFRSMYRTYSVGVAPGLTCWSLTCPSWASLSYIGRKIRIDSDSVSSSGGWSRLRLVGAYSVVSVAVVDVVGSVIGQVSKNKGSSRDKIGYIFTITHRFKVITITNPHLFIGDCKAHRFTCRGLPRSVVLFL